jgi:hypothetical protein
MATKKTKSKTREELAFAKSLDKHGHVQDGGKPLAPGVTHERVEAQGKKVLKRRRFSAL